MSNISEPFPVGGAGIARELQRILFSENQDDPPVNTYAVLDGAAIPDLLDQLYGDDPPEFVCLYAGELEPDMAECAPYLVELKPESPFTTWLLSEGWGKNWGIFALASEDIKALRKHFRTFLMVNDPDNEQLYFRYYDPRVLRVYLPTCNAEETEIIFGPIESYILEDEELGMFVRFGGGQVPPIGERIGLTLPR